MHRDEAAAPHPDGAYLARPPFHPRVKPHARCACQTFAAEPVVRQETDDDRLQPLDILAQPDLPIIQVEDGIAGDLPGPVIGDISAPVGMIIGDALCGEPCGGDEEIALLAALAQRQYRVMFAEEESVRGLRAGSLCRQQPLKSGGLPRQRIGISNTPQVVKKEVLHNLLAPLPAASCVCGPCPCGRCRVRRRIPY